MNSTQATLSLPSADSLVKQSTRTQIQKMAASTAIPRPPSRKMCRNFPKGNGIMFFLLFDILFLSREIQKGPFWLQLKVMNLVMIIFYEKPENGEELGKRGD
jgi:hypothetical protein